MLNFTMQHSDFPVKHFKLQYLGDGESLIEKKNSTDIRGKIQRHQGG